MEAKVLQIGDWVECDTLYPNRTQITMQDLLWISQGKEVKPIPLTIEMLEKNGFAFGYTSNEEDIMSVGVGVSIDIPKGWVLDEGAGSVKIIFPNEYDGGLLSIDDQSYNKSMQFVWAENLNVHELQHALRLCGLNELANNFKVQ